MRKNSTSLFFAVFFTIFCFSNLLWATEFYYYDLGTLGGSYSTAYGINDLGQVVGTSFTSSGTQYAFIWDSLNGMRNIGSPGEYPNSVAYDINNSGLIVGATAPGYYVYPFSKKPGQPMEVFGFRGGAYAVNDNGQIVGGSENAGYLKNPGEELQWLGNLGGFAGSSAHDINNSSQIVGSSDTGMGASHAFLKNPGQPMQDLGTLGGSGSEAFGINNKGQVVGSSSTNVIGQSHAFLKNQDQAMQDLGTLGGSSSGAQRINDSGQVVGWSFTSEGSTHAFLNNPGTNMQDLNNLAVNLPSGTVLASAYDINNKGQIVGTSYDGQNNHAFLLTSKSLSKTYGLFIGLRDMGTGPDIRGDISALFISSSFANLPNMVTPIPLTGDRVYGDGICKDSIQYYINDIKNKIQPWDTFVLYLCAHGRTNDDSGAIKNETTINWGNEEILIGRDSSKKDIYLSDDELYTMLQGMKGSKWILLDSCSSGGFWGNHNPNDVGDLEKLENAALLAAAKEGCFAWSVPKENVYGLFSLALKDGLSKDEIDGKLKADLDPRDGEITMEELAKWCKDWAELNNYSGKVVFEMDFGDPSIFDLSKWDPGLFKTNDFIDGLPTNPVPIPSTLLLMGSGLIAITALRSHFSH